jgi:plasmid maintenance system antidote protein VapI
MSAKKMRPLTDAERDTVASALVEQIRTNQIRIKALLNAPSSITNATITKLVASYNATTMRCHALLEAIEDGEL